MPTTFNLQPEHSVAHLDISPAHSGNFTPGIEAIEIRDDEVQRFNVLAASLNPEMPALTADQLAGVARRVLRTAATGGESPFIRSRMRRAAEMRDGQRSGMADAIFAGATRRRSARVYR